jgi:hypothetical protein
VVVPSSTTTGASAYDTATVTTLDTVTATGTVSYTYFTNGTCTGTGASAGPVTLTSSGAVPKSSTEGPPLAAGSYSFDASYLGDSNYLGSTSGCEPFTVGPGTGTTATVVVESGTAAGSSAYDTATVTTSDGVIATRTVSYLFFSSTSPTTNTCTGSSAPAGTVTLNTDGSVPNSTTTEGPLDAGYYAFEATYSGDSNYAGSTSICEPFTVHRSEVQAITSSATPAPTPTGRVAAISTPTTGSGPLPAVGWALGTILLLLGGGFLVARRRISTDQIEDV